MKEDPDPSGDLTPEQQAQWQADVEALRGHHREQAEHVFRLGDLFNELEARWGFRMPLLAKLAGVSYLTIRKQGRIARRFPIGSPLRAMPLPFSILCLLAPLEYPLDWAEKAVALRAERQLRVREFARLLEDSGLRRPRARTRPHCACCGREATDPSQRIFLRTGKAALCLCSPRCARAHLASPRALVPAPPTNPKSQIRNPKSAARRRDSESQSRRFQRPIAFARSRFRGGGETPSAARLERSPRRPPPLARRQTTNHSVIRRPAKPKRRLPASRAPPIAMPGEA